MTDSQLRPHFESPNGGLNRRTFHKIAQLKNNVYTCTAPSWARHSPTNDIFGSSMRYHIPSNLNTKYTPHVKYYSTVGTARFFLAFHCLKRPTLFLKHVSHDCICTVA